MSKEREVKPLPGALMLLLLFAALAGIITLVVTGAVNRSPPIVIVGVLAFPVWVIAMVGFIVVNPNDSRVIVLFGSYKGTVKSNGFFWINPFTSKHKVSLRARNFNSEKLKVNDKAGNPIDIAAVVVWQVKDTFAAKFEVDDYERFVSTQAESALRKMAAAYHYDGEEGEITLRGSTDEVNDHLRTELDARLERAGVHVIETRISHLAYAPEIAHAMLQRQQAAAVIAARSKIVEGAVGMVEMALNALSERKVVELDDERKAAMVSNLLVVLCSDRTTPVVNAGTLYT